MHASSAFNLQPLRLTQPLVHWMVGLLAALLLLLAGFAAQAAPPPAGTSITNQARLTYVDSGGTSRTVDSNTVTTNVLQVGSLLLAASGNASAIAGGTVSYPHTLTNTGNGTDTFNLTVSSNTGGFILNNVTFQQTNSSGFPFGPLLTTTPSIAAGATFTFVVTGTLPANAAGVNSLVITATSVFTPAATASNTDTTTVTTNAVLALTKGLSPSSGAPGTTPVTYTLTYSNTGSAASGVLNITDTLPAGITLDLTSLRSSATGSTALNTTSVGGSTTSGATTVTSSYNPTTRLLSVSFNQIPLNVSGNVTFQVAINAGPPPASAGTIVNRASWAYNNGTGTPTTTNVASANTGDAVFTVTAVPSVSLAGATVATAAAGAVVSFNNVLTNNGNGPDSFNLTVGGAPTGGTPFPAGTTFAFFTTTGTQITNTGPVSNIAGSNTFTVVLRATLPANAAAGGPFSVTKTATSVLSSTVSATATDTLTALTANTVDLTNTAAFGAAGSTLARGEGAGPGAPGNQAGQLITNSLAAGSSTTFTLVANNRSSAPDNYNLAASSTVAGLNAGTLPANYSVVFRSDGGAGNCSTTGGNITNTGSVPANGSVTYCAVVTVAAGAVAGNTDMFFRLLSSTTSATDTIQNGVTVNGARSLVINTPGNQNVSPGGVVFYTHTVQNTGNVAEGGSNSTIALSTTNNAAGFTSSLYLDSNSNGVFDAADTIISGNLPAIAVGASITIFNRVEASSGVLNGAVNTTVITAVTTGGSGTPPANATVNDITTVVAGNVTLVKEQAIDTAPTCNTVVGSLAFGTGIVNARPGQCVVYRITATNVGSQNATNVVVIDSTPPTYTTMLRTPVVTNGVLASTPAVPAVGATGAFAVNGGTGASATAGGTLAPGATTIVVFGVKVND